MTLMVRLKADQLSARKGRDKPTSMSLTTFIGEAEMVGKNKGRPTTDLEITKLIKKFISNNRESLKIRPDSALEAECELLQKYLPTQMTADVLRVHLVSIVDVLDVKSIGNAMKQLERTAAGRYDPRMASTIIKELLT